MAADRQHRQLGAIALRDETHVAEDVGVGRVVDPEAILELGG